MMGREEIEWKDRSWRLLENRGQMAVDDWSGVGTLAGLGTLALRQPRTTAGLGWTEVLGRAGLGSLAGVLGYMIWTSTTKPNATEKLSTV
jgi:hypothetical protein